MRKLTLVNNQGQALLELILAISIASFFLTTFVVGIISVREAFNHSSISAEAKLLLQKEVEALRSIKETSWNSFSLPGTYHVTAEAGNVWGVAPGTVVDNKLTHGFTVADVCRLQATFALDDCSNPLSIPDPATKKITATVSWSFLGNESISSNLYLTRNYNNSVWTQTTQADFNAGTKTNTQVVNNAGGEVELTQSSSTADYGNKFLVTATSAIGIGSPLGMIDNNDKTSLRFTAQTTKTVNAIRVYLQSEVGTSPSYRYGIQANVAGNPSGTYLGSGILTSTSTGWKTITLSPSVSITAGTIYHIVVQYNSGTIRTSRYVALRQSAPLNALYPQTNGADSSANTLFNSGASWTAIGGQPIYELDYSGVTPTYEGNPFESNNNGTEIIVTGNNWFGERFSFSGVDKTSQSISFYIRRNGTPPNNLNVQIRRVSDNGVVYTGTLATPSLPTTYAFVTHTFSPAPLTLTAGTVYRVIIQTSGGSNNNSYRFYRLNTTNAANYNSITYDGTNSVFTNSPSAGATGSWVDTNNFDMSGFFFTVTSSGGYATTGTFESQTFDCTVPTAPATAVCGGTKAGYNFVTMMVSEPVATNVRLQIATNSVDGPIWSFVGPDGSDATYFDNVGAIPLSQASGRYFRFKATLDGNGAITPTLLDATLNYSP